MQHWKKMVLVVATVVPLFTLSGCGVGSVVARIGGGAVAGCENRIAAGATPGWFFGEVAGVNAAGGLAGWNNNDDLYALDIIACQESSWFDHASNGSHWGRWQLSGSGGGTGLWTNAGVSWNQYWYGDGQRNDGQWQDWAANNYIWNRYANAGPFPGDAPMNAVWHEANYNWY